MVVYFPVLDAYFVGDDFEGILEVVRGGSFGRFEHVGGNFRPVAWLTLTVDHWLYGIDPTGYHVFNVVAHAVNGALVALVAGSLLRLLCPSSPERRRREVAAFAGLVFVVLPSHTEAVSWIAGRGDVVMTTGCLGSIALWCREVTDRRWWWRAGSTAALGAALLTKESAIAIPVVMSALEVILATPSPASPSHEGSDRSRPRLATVARSAGRPWPLYVTVLAFLLVRLLARGNFVNGYGDQFESDGPIRLAGKTLLAMARSVLPSMPVAAWVVAVVCVAVGGVVGVVAWRTGRWRLTDRSDLPLVGFLVTALVVSVLPMAPSGVNAFDTGGERLVYLPSVFGVIGIAWFAGKVAQLHRRVGAALAALVVAGAVVGLVAVNTVWVEAGEASKRLVDDAGRWRLDDRLVVLNSPDTLRGAYVARNAMAASMALVYGWDTPEVREVAGVRVTSSADRVSVGPGSCGRCLRVTLLEPDSSFVRVPTAGSEWAIDGIVATVLSERQIEVRLDVPASGPDYDIWYLDRGRLVQATLGG